MTAHSQAGSQAQLPLAGQVALLTGASGAIGSALAGALARDGTDLALVGRHAPRLAAAARLAAAHGRQATVHQADLTADADIRRLAADAVGEHGGIDILIHAAGDIALGSTADSPVETFDRQHRVNVRAAYLLTQLLLGSLRQRQGQIIFINSNINLVAKAGAGPYSATKHALKALADSLRQEVNADGIRVTSVFPGQTAGALQEGLYRLAGRTYAPELLLQPADVAAVVMAALRLPRTAEVTDITVRPLQNPARPR